MIRLIVCKWAQSRPLQSMPWSIPLAYLDRRIKGSSESKDATTFCLMFLFVRGNLHRGHTKSKWTSNYPVMFLAPSKIKPFYIKYTDWSDDTHRQRGKLLNARNNFCLFSIQCFSQWTKWEQSANNWTKEEQSKCVISEFSINGTFVLKIQFMTSLD